MIWNYVITLGAGETRTTGTGNTAYFPAQNPVTGNFYSYSPKQTIQHAMLVDGFFGLQALIFPNWFLQLGLDYVQPGTSFKAEGYLTQGANVRTENFYTYKYSIESRQLLFEGKLLATIGDVLHPYFLAGLGGAFNKAYNYHTNIPVPNRFTRTYLNKTQTAFTYSLGAGIELDITNRVRVGIGYRFADLGSIKLGNAIINHATVPGTLSQPHLYSNSLLGQLTWVV